MLQLADKMDSLWLTEMPKSWNRTRKAWQDEGAVMDSAFSENVSKPPFFIKPDQFFLSTLKQTTAKIPQQTRRPPQLTTWSHSIKETCGFGLEIHPFRTLTLISPYPEVFVFIILDSFGLDQSTLSFWSKG